MVYRSISGLDNIIDNVGRNWSVAFLGSVFIANWDSEEEGAYRGFCQLSLSNSKG